MCAHWTAAKFTKELKYKLVANVKSVRKCFVRYDHDRSGELDFEEFRGVLRSLTIELEDDRNRKVQDRAIKGW